MSPNNSPHATGAIIDSSSNHSQGFEGSIAKSVGSEETEGACSVSDNSVSVSGGWLVKFASRGEGLFCFEMNNLR